MAGAWPVGLPVQPEPTTSAPARSAPRRRPPSRVVRSTAGRQATERRLAAPSPTGHLCTRTLPAWRLTHRTARPPFALEVRREGLPKARGEASRSDRRQRAWPGRDCRCAVSSVKMVEIRERSEVAIDHAALGGIRGWSTAAAGVRNSTMASTCMWRCISCQSSFCSSSPAPMRRTMGASSGKIPTTAARGPAPALGRRWDPEKRLDPRHRLRRVRPPGRSAGGRRDAAHARSDSTDHPPPAAAILVAPDRTPLGRGRGSSRGCRRVAAAHRSTASPPASPAGADPPSA